MVCSVSMIGSDDAGNPVVCASAEADRNADDCRNQCSNAAEINCRHCLHPQARRRAEAGEHRYQKRQPPAAEPPAGIGQHAHHRKPRQPLEERSQRIQHMQQEAGAEDLEASKIVDGDPVDDRLPPGRRRERHGGGHLGKGRPQEAEQRRQDDRPGRQHQVEPARPRRSAAGFGGGGLAHPVEHDGDDDDRQARFHRLADLQRAQRQQHVIAEAAGADHRGDDDHVEREHDHLVDPDHQRGLCRRASAPATVSALPCSPPCRRNP